MPAAATQLPPIGCTRRRPRPDRRMQSSIVRDEAETARLERLIDTVRRGNPYRVTRYGTLDLPGLAPIPVAGLTTVEATRRLTVEKLLQDFRIRLTLLPLEPPLKPFGHDIFADRAAGVRADHRISRCRSTTWSGPAIDSRSSSSATPRARYSLIVNRDGNISLPELGPIPVSGLRFEDARAQIQARVAEQMIGTQASVSMTDLRSIRVFVVGDAVRPGSYTVSGHATITHALFASGGVKPIGSLRNIQLKRNGKLVTRLDLYDLLLQRRHVA